MSPREHRSTLHSCRDGRGRSLSRCGILGIQERIGSTRSIYSTSDINTEARVRAQARHPRSVSSTRMLMIARRQISELETYLQLFEYIQSSMRWLQSYLTLLEQHKPFHRKDPEILRLLREAERGYVRSTMFDTYTIETGTESAFSFRCAMSLDAPLNLGPERSPRITRRNDEYKRAAYQTRLAHPLPIRSTAFTGQNTAANRNHDENHTQDTSVECKRTMPSSGSVSDDDRFRSSDKFGRRSLQRWKIGAGKSKSWKHTSDSSQSGAPAAFSRGIKCKRRGSADDKYRTGKLEEITKKKKKMELHKQCQRRRKNKYSIREALLTDLREWNDAYSEGTSPNLRVTAIQQKSLLCSITTKDDWDTFLIVATTSLQPYQKLPSLLGDLNRILEWFERFYHYGDDYKDFFRGRHDLRRFVLSCRSFIEGLLEGLDGNEGLYGVNIHFPPDFGYYWIMRSLPFLQHFGFISIKQAAAVKFILCQIKPWNETTTQLSPTDSLSRKFQAEIPGAQQPRKKRRRRRKSQSQPSADGISHSLESGVSTNLPKNYKWLPKSAKRRFRKRRQKETKETKKLLERDSPKERRRMVLSSGKSPFRCCVLVHRYFSCGHIVRSLCSSCNEAWKRAEIVPCQLETELSRGQCFLDDLYRHFPTPCVKCPWDVHPILSSDNRHARTIPEDIMWKLTEYLGDISISSEDEPNVRYPVSKEGLWYDSEIDEDDSEIDEDDGDEEPALPGKNFKLPFYYH